MYWLIDCVCVHLTFYLRHGPSLNLDDTNSVRLLGQQTLGSLLSLFPQSEWYRHLAFYVDLDNPNLDAHPCRTSSSWLSSLPGPRIAPRYLTVCTDKVITDNSLSYRPKIFDSSTTVCLKMFALNISMLDIIPRKISLIYFIVPWLKMCF